MTDVLTKEQRSRNMSAIHSKDTKPELYIRKMIFAKGYRYRKNVKYIDGHPDLFLRKYNTAIFINGCFWHRHKGCKYASNPKSRIEFWEEKFRKNVERDKTVKINLEKQGIKQLVIWECTAKAMKKDHELEIHSLNRIEEFLHSNEKYLEL